MVGDTTHNDGSKGPEHLQHLCSRSSQPERHDLATVRWCICDEDTPGDAFEELRGQHDSQRVGKVENEDESVQGHETRDGRPPVSNLAGKGAGEEDTHKGPNWPSHLQCRLPRGRDEFLAADGVFHAVCVFESRKSNKVPHEENTVGLHDLYMVRDVFPDWWT